MRRIVIGAAAGILLVLASVATAGAAMMQARLHPTGNLHVTGAVLWPKVSETVPIVLSVEGAKPNSRLFLRVCGPSMNGDTGKAVDQCWATFQDVEHFQPTITVGARGRANAILYAKLGAGPTFLLKPKRFELYSMSDLTKPIAVGQLNSRR